MVGCFQIKPLDQLKGEPKPKISIDVCCSGTTLAPDDEQISSINLMLSLGFTSSLNSDGRKRPCLPSLFFPGVVLVACLDKVLGNIMFRNREDFTLYMYV